MGVKITIPRKVQRALGVKVQNNKIVKALPKLVVDVRKEFSNKAPKAIRQAILRDVTKGISPVEGEGKFKKYSTSYKKAIRGQGMFRNIGGKTVFFEGVEDPKFAAASPIKRASPVTLRLTGQLHNALKVFTTGGFAKSFRLIFDWRDKLADIHNRRGAGKAKAVRRMLPTESGEEFNSTITDVIIDRLKRAAKKIADRHS